MDNILDELEKKNTQRRYSKYSFLISVLTLASFIYLFSIIPKKISVGARMQEPSWIIVHTTQIFCIIGIIMMIVSFVNGEPSTWYKWIGAILNILLLIVLVGLAIFARTV